MSNFNRVLLAIILASTIALPVIATRYSWGIAGEKNPTIVERARKNRSHRSVYGRRSYYGGGPRGGK